MPSDPLRHLRYQMDPIALRPGISGWAVSDGGAAPSFWLLCEDRGADMAWSWVHDLDTLDGDELTLCEVIDQVGPINGADVVAWSSARIAELRQRDGTAAAIDRIAADLHRAEVGLALRVRHAREAHLQQAHGVARQLQLIGAPADAHDDAALPFDYLARTVVRESPGRWCIFRDENDEDPVLMRFWTQPEPGDLPGWKTSHASLEGVATRWRPRTVASACHQVGPLHAGDVLGTSARMAARMAEGDACGLKAQVDAARGEIGAWVAHVLRCHIQCAQELAVMEERLATPGMRAI